MMYSSKQKLAMAMAATMAVSAVPAMSFAATDVDMVLDQLNSTTTPKQPGKEDVAATMKGDLASAEAAYDAAQKVSYAADSEAEWIVKAYGASLGMLKAKNMDEFNMQEKLFNDALAQLKVKLSGPEAAQNLANSFMHAQTLANHKKVKDALAGPAVPGDAKEIDGLLVKMALGNVVDVMLPSKDPVTDVMLNGAAAKFKQTEDKLRVVLGNGVTTGVITFKMGAQVYKVNIKEK